jgi:nucleoside transporter
MAHVAGASVELSAPSVPMGLRLNLSVMMFLQFAIWGAWFVVLGNYIGAMDFTNIGSYYATMSLGSIISPIFVGQIADRYFSSERLMAFLHFCGAVVLLWMSTISDPMAFYWAALLYALLYSPTLALANSIAFTHLPDATRDFPGVRVLGTIGWIVAGYLVTASLLAFAGSSDEIKNLPIAAYSMVVGGTRTIIPLALAGLLSLLLAGWSLLLPHTPPTGKPGDAFPFLRAVGLMKEFPFAVFYGVSFVITIVLAFYYNYTGLYLQQAHQVKEAAVSSYMAIGQWAEMILLPLLPWFLYRMGMKWVLTLGMLCWGIRYGIFSYFANAPEFFSLILVGIALHGICFDFFFAAGFIHVDNKAPRDIRASAQALFGFLTYGAGMYLGGIFSGWLEGKYTTKFFDQSLDKEVAVVDWQTFWLVPCLGVLVSLVVFIALFRDRASNQPQ